MLRRAIHPVHAQMLLSHACLLHLSQPFQPLLAVAASTTRSQPCSAACAITVSRRKATFAAASLLHGVATALTALSRGPPDDERPGGHDRVRSRSRFRSRGDSRASPPRGDGAPPTEPSHELVQAAAAVVMAAKGTGNSAGTGKGNGHGKGKGKNKDKGSRR